MAFYQCPKCKKVWQYPIEQCPDCFEKLKRVYSKKAIVIGVSKVSIPSLFHPRVPYFVLLLEDENGNRWVQKSIKEYKIGDIVEYKPSLDKNSVAIWRVKYDILEGIERVIDLVGGINVNSETKIVVLPTLISPAHPHLAENTSPGFLDATIKYLIQRGAKPENIKITGQSFNDFPIEASVQKSRFLEVIEKYNVQPMDLSKTDFVKKGEIEISEEAFQNDLVLNLPILKLDKELGIKGASYNLLKFLKKQSYSSLKYLQGEQYLIEKVKYALPQVFTLADGISIQKSDKFIVYLGLVLAGFNFTNLDRVFAEVSMIKALPNYLNKIKIETIPIVGREIEEVRYNVEQF